jgi:carbon storage regulator CsrA
VELSDDDGERWVPGARLQATGEAVCRRRERVRAGILRIKRRVGERIILGDNVIIEVTEIKGQTVRIGIDGPVRWRSIARSSGSRSSARTKRRARFESGQLPDVSARLKDTGR